jgi:hypothetical protein
MVIVGRHGAFLLSRSPRVSQNFRLIDRMRSVKLPIAFAAKSSDVVDEFCAAALKAGGSENGAHGLCRPNCGTQDYYDMSLSDCYARGSTSDLCSMHSIHTSLRVAPNLIFRQNRSGGIGPFLALKELMMTPKFLRDEAARFRGMAGTADLEASRQRLLAMAVDFESRATAADGSIEPKPTEGIKVKAGKKIAKELNEPD